MEARNNSDCTYIQEITSVIPSLVFIDEANMRTCQEAISDWLVTSLRTFEFDVKALTKSLLAYRKILLILISNLAEMALDSNF